MQKTSASAVSARLRKAGFAIVGGDRRREGIRVSKSVLDEVHIVVDLDIDRQGKRLADLVDEELKTWEGYEYRRRDDVFFYIAKAEPQAPIVDLLAAHQPIGPLLQRGRGVMTCTCGEQVEIVDAPYCPPEVTQVSIPNLRHAFAAHQAKILREHASITAK